MQGSFSRLHPFVSFLYFALVISFSLMLTHPLAQIIALFCAIIYAIKINNKQSIGFLLKLSLPTVLLAALINPIFNHRGATILLYFSNGNPLTLESIVYGLFMGVMLITIMFWFSSFSKIMTTDKFIYLFGKIIPSLSLILSMSLRLLPNFKRRMQSIAESRKAMGKDIANGNIINKIKNAVSIFSIMISWAFENSIDTADSMKSRGYGVKKRTAFSTYRFYKQDKFVLIFMCMCAFILFYGVFKGRFSFSYFPSVSFTPINKSTIPFYIVYFLVCITPIIIDLRKEILWKTLVSKI